MMVVIEIARCNQASIRYGTGYPCIEYTIPNVVSIYMELKHTNKLHPDERLMINQLYKQLLSPTDILMMCSGDLDVVRVDLKGSDLWLTIQ